MVKERNLEKIAQVLKEFSKNSAENHVFLNELALYYDLTLYSF